MHNILPWGAFKCSTPFAWKMASARSNVYCWPHFSTTSSSVDQFIDYAMRACKGKPDQAMDVLRSGLSVAGDTSVDGARLHLALAELQMDVGNVDEVQNLVHKAGSALTAAGTPGEDIRSLITQMRLHCNTLCVRSLLIQGKDEKACQKAESAVAEAKEMSYPKIHCLGLSLVAAHAASSSIARHLEAATSAASQLIPRTMPQEGTPDEERPAPTSDPEGGGPHHPPPESCVSLGHWLISQGKYSDARRVFGIASEAAALEQASSSSKSAPIIREGDWGEVLADALLGSAQAEIAEERWGPAEELLGRSLKAAEAVSSDKHLRVALVLMLLGKVYARTARVMFAEGMYRESAKLIQLEAGGKPWKTNQGVHPSIPAVLAWQFHQLLTALPNRGGESGTWASCARDLWHSSSLCGVATGVDRPRDIPPEEVLGDPTFLKGEGKPGRGAVLSMRIRRALPVLSK